MVMECAWKTIAGIPGWFGCETVEGVTTSSWYFPVAWIAIAVVIVIGYEIYKRRS